MKWYYMMMGIDDEGDPPYPFMAGEEDLSGFSYENFDVGRVVDGWNPNSLVRGIDPAYDGRMDDVLGNAARFPVISERLRSALLMCGVGVHDIQYLPIRVMRCTGEEVSGFAVANVIARVPALDTDRSFMLQLDSNTIDPLTGKAKVKNFGRAALRYEALGGHDVIRLLEFAYAIFVSERFVRVFMEYRCTGAEFSPVVVS